MVIMIDCKNSKHAVIKGKQPLFNRATSNRVGQDFRRNTPQLTLLERLLL
jgi:hypothetical protein